MDTLRIFTISFIVFSSLISKIHSEEEAAAGIRSVVHRSEQSSADHSRVTQLSWRPRAFLYEGFLTDEECDHIIKLAKKKLARSTVADNESGKSLLSNVRTSSGMFLDKGQDDIVRRIEDRISAWTFLPRGVVLKCGVNTGARYEHGQKYEPHYDYFSDEVNKARGGDRYATVLIYLTTVTKGGETVFPKVEDKRFKDDSWSDCGKTGLAVKPRKGDALLFFSLHPNGTRDEYSLHTACPVIEGEKWSAPTWIHVRPFQNVPGKIGCIDSMKECPGWAANGECQKNPAYMVGTPNSPGFCRKSCKVC